MEQRGKLRAMSKKRILVAALAVVLLGVVAAGSLYWWTRPQVLRTGNAVVLVEGHSLSLSASEGGMGIGGPLGIVGDHCIGLVGSSDGTILVWPPGTTVKVVDGGKNLEITSEGVTVRLGDQISGDTNGVSDFPEFADQLPDSCRGLPMVDISLGL